MSTSDQRLSQLLSISEKELCNGFSIGLSSPMHYSHNITGEQTRIMTLDLNQQTIPWLMHLIIKRKAIQSNYDQTRNHCALSFTRGQVFHCKVQIILWHEGCNRHVLNQLLGIHVLKKMLLDFVLEFLIIFFIINIYYL